jgi:neutral ceramidase
MKTGIVKLIVILIIIFVSVKTFGQKNTAEKSEYRMGVSTINITPIEPVLMSGYAKRITPSTGIHDSIYASALYFTGNNTRTLIITSDLIGFTAQLVDELKSIINTRTGIPNENILITAVHNHGGPSPRTYESNVPGSTFRYVDTLKQKFVSLAVAAVKNPMPFKMGIGKGACFLNINRRAVFSDGYIGLGRDQTKPCDHELFVVKFEDLYNNTIAVLINWPCHGTASGQDNYLITGDWPGAAARYIKKQIGENVIVAVTAGASADINPIYGPGTSFSEINAVGYNVANESLKIMKNIKVTPVKSLEASYITATFPGKKPGKDNKPPQSFEPGPDVELRISGLKIGDLVLEGISGELMNEIGSQVKKMSSYPNTVLITHCNGSSGYICTDAAYPEGGYEVASTRLMPGVEKPLVSKFLEQIRLYNEN